MPRAIRKGGADPDNPGSGPGDAEDVKRFLRGEEAAFDRIVKGHAGAVHSLLRRLMGNGSDVEDMAQETFMRVFRHLEGFEGASSLRTWILRIATNVALDWRRERKRKPRSASLEEGVLLRISGAPGEHPSGRLAAKESLEAVHLALDRLPFMQRAALIMKVTEGMSYEEIARGLDTTVNSAKSSVHLARKRLLGLLDAHWPKAGAQAKARTERGNK